jgi:hypothetical protein
VRFDFDAEPLTVRVCWCRDCRYWASGNGAVNLIFPSAAMTLEGAMAGFDSVADSGTVMRREFCPTCGTPLFSRAESRPHIVVVRAGAMDDPEVARPQLNIWTASAPDWAQIDPDLPCCERQPPPTG